MPVLMDNRGKIVIAAPPAGSYTPPVIVSLVTSAGAGLLFAPAFITHCKFGCTINAGVQPTLNGKLYYTEFGDSVVPLTVGGVAYDQVCSGVSAGTGIDTVTDFYQNYRGKGSGTTAPVRSYVKIGSFTLTCMLHQFDLEYNIAATPAPYFRFLFSFIPLTQPWD